MSYEMHKQLRRTEAMALKYQQHQESLSAQLQGKKSDAGVIYQSKESGQPTAAPGSTGPTFGNKQEDIEPFTKQQGFPLIKAKVSLKLQNYTKAHQ